MTRDTTRIESVQGRENIRLHALPYLQKYFDVAFVLKEKQKRGILPVFHSIRLGESRKSEKVMELRVQ